VKARQATAVAHPNIALVKYWGKRDEALLLPHQSSLSVTLAPLAVRTTVRFGTPRDVVRINGRAAIGQARDRVLRVLHELRKERPGLGRAAVTSVGDFPASAGLASSAAAFAALSVAARAAAGFPANPRAASRLARLGSGSACRSVQGGFCVWRRGRAEDGRDSYATQAFPETHWPQLRLMVALLSRAEKEVSSREGMRRTVKTSPYYAAWADDAEREVPRAARFIAKRDLEGLGELAERNAWRMHAAALGADPPLCYLLPETLRLLLEIRAARSRGLPVWFTLDAGPNPVLLTDARHAQAVGRLAASVGAGAVETCWPGGDARVVASAML
jgi:diphosphomevalonate decarboxylase